MILANAYLVNGSVTTIMIVLTEVTNLCVVLIHSLTVPMEDVSNGIHGVMETMTAETTAMKMNVRVRLSFILVTILSIFCLKVDSKVKKMCGLTCLKYVFSKWCIICSFDILPSLPCDFLQMCIRIIL